MRCMVLVRADRASEAGALPSEQEMARMSAFNQQLADAGVLRAGEGLQPSSRGARVLFSHGKRTVVDGPFPATRELVAGFWLWQVGSLAEAIEWVQRAPFGDGAEIEIRPLLEDEDFGSAFTPELRDQEERMRAQVAARK